MCMENGPKTLDHPLANQIIYTLSTQPRGQEKLNLIESLKGDLLRLFEQGVDLNKIRSATGDGLVHICAYKGLTQTLKDLVKFCHEQGIELDLTAPDDKIGHTPLHLACSVGKTELVQFLLESGKVNVNAQDGALLTPAHLASGVGDPSIRKATLEALSHHGADLSIKDKQNRTPHEIQPLNYFNETTGANFLKQNKLHFAGSLIKIEVVKSWSTEFIEKFINETDLCGRSPLVYWVYSNNKEIIELLAPFTKQGINSIDNTGKTSLFFAAIYASADTINILLKLGANPTIADNHGKTPIDVAKMYGRNDIAELLERHLLLTQTTSLTFSEKRVATPPTPTVNPAMNLNLTTELTEKPKSTIN